GSNTQWQVGFSGTCSPQAAPSFFCPGGINAGFWGWCAFGGSDSTGAAGSNADCQIETYFGPGTSLHINYNVTGWVIVAVPPPAPFPTDFILTTGTITLSGPGVVGNPFGFRAHVPIPFPFPDGTCPPMVCDTGIPAAPGHYSLHPTPGAELNIQVTKLP